MRTHFQGEREKEKIHFFCLTNNFDERKTVFIETKMCLFLTEPNDKGQKIKSIYKFRSESISMDSVTKKS
jgi:hypothetical protein